MEDNNVIAQSEIILVGKSPVILVEKSLEELIKMLGDNSAFISITDVEGKQYIFPKAVVKMISGYAK
jgi:hypothetical protein